MMLPLVLAAALSAPADYSSCYRPGYSYWSGGSYCGDSSYPPGYYAPGYYSCYVANPVFIKYLVDIPTVALPTYRAYYEARAAAPALAPAPPPTAPVSSTADAKLDKVIEMLSRQDGRIARLEAAVFKGATAPAAAEAPPSAVADFVDACAKCHEAKVSKAEGGGFTMFVGEQLAKLDAKGLLLQLDRDDGAKMRKQLVGGKMPPKEDSRGGAVAPLADDRRKRMIAFIDAEMGK